MRGEVQNTDKKKGWLLLKGDRGYTLDIQSVYILYTLEILSIYTGYTRTTNEKRVFFLLKILHLELNIHHERAMRAHLLHLKNTP